MLLEHSDFFGWFLEDFERQLREMWEIWRPVLAISFAIDNMVEQLAWLEDGDEGGDGENMGGENQE